MVVSVQGHSDIERCSLAVHLPLIQQAETCLI